MGDVGPDGPTGPDRTRRGRAGKVSSGDAVKGMNMKSPKPDPESATPSSRAVPGGALVLSALAAGLLACTAAPASAAAVTGTAQAAGNPRSVHYPVELPTDPWTLSITSSDVQVEPGSGAWITATSNLDVGPTPYYIYIVDNDTHGIVAQCGDGTVCSVEIFRSVPGWDSFDAYIAPSSEVGGGHVADAWLVPGVEWGQEV